MSPCYLLQFLIVTLQDNLSILISQTLNPNLCQFHRGLSFCGTKNHFVSINPIVFARLFFPHLVWVLPFVSFRFANNYLICNICIQYSMYDVVFISLYHLTVHLANVIRLHSEKYAPSLICTYLGTMYSRFQLQQNNKLKKLT